MCPYELLHSSVVIRHAKHQPTGRAKREMINTARPSLHNGGEASADDCTIKADGASTPQTAAMHAMPARGRSDRRRARGQQACTSPTISRPRGQTRDDQHCEAIASQRRRGERRRPHHQSRRCQHSPDRCQARHACERPLRPTERAWSAGMHIITTSVVSRHAHHHHQPTDGPNKR